MKKMCLLVALVSLAACSSDENITNLNNEEVQNFSKKDSNSKEMSLFDIQNEIVAKYNDTNLSNYSIENKIASLKGIAKDNTAFFNLANGIIPDFTIQQVNEVLNNTNSLYESLNVTSDVKDIVSEIVEGNLSKDEIYELIQNNSTFTNSQVEMLTFLADNGDDDKDRLDITWRKRRAIVSINAYQLSPAQAVFSSSVITVIAE